MLLCREDLASVNVRSCPSEADAQSAVSRFPRSARDHVTYSSECCWASLLPMVSISLCWTFGIGLLDTGPGLYVLYGVPDSDSLSSVKSNIPSEVRNLMWQEMEAREKQVRSL